MFDTALLLALGATYRNLEKGQVIFQEETVPIFYHQLVEGRVKLVNCTPSGRECIHDFIEIGESFGEIALLQDVPYITTALTEDASTILRLPKNDFNCLLRQHPEHCHELLKVLSTRLRFKTLLVRELYNYSPTIRIKSFIASIKGQKKFICPITKKLLLTRQQVADMTGLRVETVIRTLRALQKESVVQIDEKGKVYC